MNLLLEVIIYCFLKNAHFTSIRCTLALCTLHLGSKIPVRLSPLHTFSSTGFNEFLLFVTVACFLGRRWI